MNIHRYLNIKYDNTRAPTVSFSFCVHILLNNNIVSIHLTNTNTDTHVI